MIGLFGGFFSVDEKEVTRSYLRRNGMEIPQQLMSSVERQHQQHRRNAMALLKQHIDNGGSAQGFSYSGDKNGGYSVEIREQQNKRGGGE